MRLVLLFALWHISGIVHSENLELPFVIRSLLSTANDCIFMSSLRSYVPSWFRSSPIDTEADNELVRLSATEARNLIRNDSLTVERYARALVRRVKARDTVVRAWTYFGSVLFVFPREDESC